MRTLILALASVATASIIIIFLSSNKPKTLSTDPNRFSIRIDNKTGYIDGNGVIAIEPTFESGDEFSEGLCAVRLKGLYGFIDIKGEVVIEPQFDYATRFIEGAALVFVNSKPLFIDRKGNFLFNSVYRSMSPFASGRSFIRTYSDKSGVIDKTGKLLIDTVYSRIDDFSDGLAIAYGINHDVDNYRKKAYKPEVTIIDNLGRQLIPYGNYTTIAGPGEGYFTARLLKKNGREGADVLLDATGKILYTLPEPRKDYAVFDGTVTQGIIRASLPGKDSDRENHRDVYMTINGKIIFESKEMTLAYDFSNGRAFFGDESYDYSFINTKGKIVSTRKYNQVLTGRFNNGKAFVQTDEGWGVIDTLDRFIVEPKFEGIDVMSVDSDFIFFTKYDTTSETEFYGIADSHGNVIVDATLDQVDRRGFVNGLLLCVSDGKSTYLNTSGKVIWQGISDRQGNHLPLNIDHMNRGYFVASGDATGHGGGWGAEPQGITKVNSFNENEFTVVAVPDRQHETRSSIQTMTVFVANSTGDTVNFNAQDGRLYMKMQAIDKNGEWRDIEYLPSSWCGNSYHTMGLAPNYYWSFPAPVYQGAIETKMRIELKVIDGKAERRQFEHIKNEKTFYSNEFFGSINPGQFWRKVSYSPIGIMDPYND